MSRSKVSLVLGDKLIVYPNGSDNYSPHIRYPEYPFSEVSSGKNEVYALVRELFHTAGYDQDNYGRKEWNPLGFLIQPGMSVVIKPNWVNDDNPKGANEKDPYGMECLVTHPSVVRAICDYCLIALKGKGNITVCDAPIQDCNFGLLCERAGIHILKSFYEVEKENVSFVDLRKEVRITNRFDVKKHTIERDEQHVYVHMDGNTAFYNMHGNSEFQVPNYDTAITKSFHRNGEHIYSISKRILESDAIINLCKPKCHRYAGITAAMKNCVGMVAEKETLPHRRFGDASKGGDSYLKKSRIKEKIDDVLRRQAKLENKGKVVRATICRFEYGILYYLRKIHGEDPSLKGCWHGNDTIWRTILDLNYVVRYADSNGQIQSQEQRKILNIGDMIIAGQHNGPLSPEPKRLGMLLCSEDVNAFDRTVCKIMGFDFHKIPSLKSIFNNESWLKNKVVELKSSPNQFSGKMDELEFPKEWRFIPHDAWKGFVEGEE